MEMTNFSRSVGVMCFSCAHSVYRSSGRALGRWVVVNEWSESDDEVDSRLDDSPSIGMSAAAAAKGFVAGRDCDLRWQQKVSLFHNRQLRFSSRLPSSTAWEALEKSDH